VFPAVSDLSRSLTPWTIAAVGASLLALVLLVLLIRQYRRQRHAAQAVAEARGHLHSITATMREGVIAYDMGLGFTFANPAFERLTGYTAEDLADQEFLQYLHPEDRPALIAEWDRLKRGGALRDQEYRVVTRDGQVRWSSSSWEPLRHEDGRQIGYLGTEFDITERKLAEEELRLDTELFQTVIEVQQAVTAAGLDAATVLHVIADRSQRLTRADGAVIEAIVGDEVVPRFRLGIDAPRFQLANSLSGLCVRTGEVQRCDDTSTDSRIGHTAYQELGVHSLLAVPLKDDQRTLGVLKMVSKRPHAFSDRDAKALRLLGSLMGAALGQAATFESRQTRLEERTHAIQESEQRFKHLVDVAQEGIWVTDVRGVITYVNPRLANLLGYESGALLGHPISDFLDSDSRAPLRALAGPATGGTDSKDLLFRRQDGSDLWGLVSVAPIPGRDGAMVGSVGMVTDITERKRAEERLRRSADRLAMLHDLDQAVLAARSPEEIGRAALGRVRRMVPCQRCTVVLFDFPERRAQLIAGYSGGVALNPAALPLEQISPADVQRRATVRYEEDISTIEDPSPTIRQLAHEGLRSVMTVPLLIDGEAIGEINLAASDPAAFEPEHRDIALEVATPLAVAIQHARLRDDVARQMAELERRVAERGAALRGATAELETLLYSLSHDLRAPVRHIGGFAHLLLDDCGSALDPAARQYAERIRDGASRLAGLLDDLVNLARISRQDLLRREVNFNTLVEDLIGQIEREVDGRRVDWQVEPLPVIQCDLALARVALGNLLSNAVKFTRPREEAVIRVRPIEADGQPGIAVQDNGVGFKMAYAGKLFGVFQRLHRPDEFEGNGAGLAVVQRIAHKHGGRVWAESEVDGGATFSITFGPPNAG
jgi:PAS domain S-box-containing protein